MRLHSSLFLDAGKRLPTVVYSSLLDLIKSHTLFPTPQEVFQRFLFRLFYWFRSSQRRAINVLEMAFCANLLRTRGKMASTSNSHPENS
jgi:hypothetical protein